MNGFQRIQNVLKGEWPDKRPVMLHNFLLAAREAGFTQKEYRESPEIIAKAHIQAIEKYQYDGVLVDIDTTSLAASLGVPVDYPEDEPARTYGVKIISLEDVESLKPVDISKNERIQIWLEACRIIKKYFGDEIFVRGNCDQAPFSLASMVRGPADWMMDLITDDDFISELLDYCTDITLQFITLMSETGVDMVSNGDSTAGPEMISPEMYKKYAWPYEKRIVEKAHKENLSYCLHICGNTDSILEDMVTTGTDALELDYKTNIQEIFKTCSDKIAFIGNIDPSGILAMGNKGDVERETIKLLRVYKDSPRIIINAGCAIPAETPFENIMKMIEIARRD